MKDDFSIRLPRTAEPSSWVTQVREVSGSETTKLCFVNIECPLTTTHEPTILRTPPLFYDGGRHFERWYVYLDEKLRYAGGGWCDIDMFEDTEVL